MSECAVSEMYDCSVQKLNGLYRFRKQVMKDTLKNRCVKVTASMLLRRIYGNSLKGAMFFLAPSQKTWQREMPYFFRSYGNSLKAEVLCYSLCLFQKVGTL